jgi:hypothetical protein
MRSAYDYAPAPSSEAKPKGRHERKKVSKPGDHITLRSPESYADSVPGKQTS